MDQFTINLLFVGASFALYIGIAIWARAGSTSEFYAAGRGVHPVTNGMATAADWMSAASFISMAGLIAFTGYDNLAVTCSIGISQYQAPEALNNSLARADKALYQAKAEGGNKVVCA